MIDQYEAKITQKDDIIKNKDDTIIKEIAHRDDIIKNKEDIIKSKDETILTLTHENTNLKTMLNGAGTIVEKSISAFNYVTKNYTEAPVLKCITDVPALHIDLSEDQVVDNVIDEYRNDNLIGFIGDLIIKNYKKKDPKMQSVWNSDTDRLTYVVRILLNKKYYWKMDKKGIDTSNYIIKPILNYIKQKLKDYMKTSAPSKRSDETQKIMTDMNNMNDSHKIITLIESNDLLEDILKYIAPHLYLSKEAPVLV